MLDPEGSKISVRKPIRPPPHKSQTRSECRRPAGVVSTEDWLGRAEGEDTALALGWSALNRTRNRAQPLYIGTKMAVFQHHFIHILLFSLFSLHIKSYRRRITLTKKANFRRFFPPCVLHTLRFMVVHSTQRQAPSFAFHASCVYMTSKPKKHKAYRLMLHCSRHSILSRASQSKKQTAHHPMLLYCYRPTNVHL